MQNSERSDTERAATKLEVCRRRSLAGGVEKKS